MENIVTLLIITALSVALIRLLAMPLRLFAKLLIHSGCGFLCLWLLNTVSSVSGMYLPVNSATVLIAGFLGLPGIGVIALLEILN